FPMTLCILHVFGMEAYRTRCPGCWTTPKPAHSGSAGRESANAGQLLAAEHIEDALDADSGLEQDLGGALGGDVADAAGAGAVWALAQDSQGAFGVGLGHEGGKTALAGHVQRVQS